MSHFIALITVIANVLFVNRRKNIVFFGKDLFLIVFLIFICFQQIYFLTWL
jgi:hypothetical protein